jgi:uncharacterized protein involved in exopolysaccharide biosynthesis
MNNNQNNPAPQALPEADEINLIDLLIVLVKNKAMIIKITLAGAILSVGYSLSLDNIYTSTTKILPPQSSQSTSANSVMLAQLGVLAGGAGAALGSIGKDPNAIYIAMLKSRTITEKIVAKFDLKTIYKKESLTDTIKSLLDASNMVSSKDGLITIEVDDKDPQRAANLANAYVEELNSLMQTLAITEASQRRLFFETQLKPAKDRLSDAEIKLDRTLKTSLAYLDALRDQKYLEGVYEIIVRQFEAAKMDEAKNSPLIQVLDKAIPPEKKSKPKRSLIVILAMIVCFFLATIWTFIREAMLKLKERPEQAQRLLELSAAFRIRK